MKKNSWKDYFTFSAKERNAIVILFIVMAAFIALPFLFSAKEKKVAPDEKLEQQIAQLQKPDSAESIDNTEENEDDIAPSSAPHNYQATVKKDSLFYFDPNILDENGFKTLGLTDKNIHTIINYRNKGGKFYKPEDFSKIYGLSKLKVDELIPFIRIKNQQQDFQNKTFYKKDSVLPISAKQFPVKKYSVIHVNTATAEDFKSLPGIGDVLGNRIVKFRDKIGGFKSVDDVKKTYGLSDSVFQNIKPYLQL